ncbi:MAG: queuosine precursor transporter [Desulfonatronovibrionaceae bacterium]
MNGNFSLTLLTCAFAGSLVISAVLAAKIITVCGLVVPAGVLAYSVTFIATDVISEIWGKKQARQTVFGGFAALLVSMVLIKLCLLWPPAGFWEGQESFEAVLGLAPRIILASFTAYLLSQTHDVWAFHFWKKVFAGRHLWLRNNISTASSQLLDTLVFISIAFLGTMPVGQLIAGQYIVKLGIALLDTPVVYLMVWLIRKNLPPSGSFPVRTGS